MFQLVIESVWGFHCYHGESLNRIKPTSAPFTAASDSGFSDVSVVRYNSFLNALLRTLGSNYFIGVRHSCSPIREGRYRICLRCDLSRSLLGSKTFLMRKLLMAAVGIRSVSHLRCRCLVLPSISARQDITSAAQIRSPSQGYGMTFPCLMAGFLPSPATSVFQTPAAPQLDICGICFLSPWQLDHHECPCDLVKPVN